MAARSLAHLIARGLGLVLGVALLAVVLLVAFIGWGRSGVDVVLLVGCLALVGATGGFGHSHEHRHD